jgi:hypothetical protein
MLLGSPGTRSACTVTIDSALPNLKHPPRHPTPKENPRSCLPFSRVSIHHPPSSSTRPRRRPRPLALAHRSCADLECSPTPPLFARPPSPTTSGNVPTATTLRRNGSAWASPEDNESAVAPLLLRAIRRRSCPPCSKVATVECRGQQIDAVAHLDDLQIRPTTTSPTQKKGAFFPPHFSALYPVLASARFDPAVANYRSALLTPLSCEQVGGRRWGGRHRQDRPLPRTEQQPVHRREDGDKK